MNQSGCSLTQGWSGETLEGDVEGEFHAVVVGGGDEVVEVGEGAELGMDGLVAAFGRADCPGAADVVRVGGGGVVGAFAEGAADGVDGRHVEDVEAHGGDVGQQCFDVGEGAVAGWVGRSGAGKELVPTGEAGALAIDPEMELFGVSGEGEVGIAGGKLLDLRRERVFVEGELLVGERAQRRGDGFEAFGVGGLRFLAQRRRGRRPGRGAGRRSRRRRECPAAAGRAWRVGAGGSGWAARRLLRSSHQVSKWSIQAWMV